MSTLDDWYAANQAYLTASLARVGAALDREDEQTDTSSAHAKAISEQMAWPPALETICLNFELSSFERDVLLLCAGVELDTKFAKKLPAAPTFGLALAGLADPHWSALAPGGPLRHWRLVELPPGGSLTESRLRIDERILHYLTGVQHMDERLASSLELFPDELATTTSHRTLAKRIVDTLRRNDEQQRLPIVEQLKLEPTGDCRRQLRVRQSRGCAMPFPASSSWHPETRDVGVTDPHSPSTSRVPHRRTSVESGTGSSVSPARRLRTS